MGPIDEVCTSSGGGEELSSGHGVGLVAKDSAARVREVVARLSAATAPDGDALGEGGGRERGEGGGLHTMQLGLGMLCRLAN